MAPYWAVIFTSRNSICGFIRNKSEKIELQIPSLSSESAHIGTWTDIFFSRDGFIWTEKKEKKERKKSRLNERKPVDRASAKKAQQYGVLCTMRTKEIFSQNSSNFLKEEKRKSDLKKRMDVGTFEHSPTIQFIWSCASYVHEYDPCFNPG